MRQQRHGTNKSSLTYLLHWFQTSLFIEVPPSQTHKKAEPQLALPGILYYEKMGLATFLLLHLSLNGHRGVGHNHQTFLGDKFARNTADAVGLILDTHQSGI